MSQLHPNLKKMYGNIILGFKIRRQIGHTTIFRVRHGNGYYGSELGKEIQDKYSYFVPTSINNTNGQAARDALSTAVSNWKYNLTEAQKKVYNKRAYDYKYMSGYNLYIKEYITEYL